MTTVNIQDQEREVFQRPEFSSAAMTDLKKQLEDVEKRELKGNAQAHVLAQYYKNVIATPEWRRQHDGKWVRLYMSSPESEIRVKLGATPEDVFVSQKEIYLASYITHINHEREEEECEEGECEEEEKL